MEYGIKRESGSFDYLASGALYQSTLRLRTEGCVYLTYTPRHITRTVLNNKEIKFENPTPNPQG